MAPQGYYALANWDGSLSTRPPSPLPPLPSPPPQPSEAVVSVSTVSVHGRTSIPPLTDTSIQHSKQPEPHVRMALSRHRGTANANAIANTHAPGTAMGRLAYADSSESSVELPVGKRDADARKSDSASHYQSEKFLVRLSYIDVLCPATLANASVALLIAASHSTDTAILALRTCLKTDSILRLLHHVSMLRVCTPPLDRRRLKAVSRAGSTMATKAYQLCSQVIATNIYPCNIYL